MAEPSVKAIQSPVGGLGLAVAEKRIVFTLRETTGNIWMATLAGQPD